MGEETHHEEILHANIEMTVCMAVGVFYYAMNQFAWNSIYSTMIAAQQAVDATNTPWWTYASAIKYWGGLTTSSIALIMQVVSLFGVANEVNLLLQGYLWWTSFVLTIAYLTLALLQAVQIRGSMKTAANADEFAMYEWLSNEVGGYLGFKGFEYITMTKAWKGWEAGQEEFIRKAEAAGLLNL